MVWALGLLSTLISAFLPTALNKTCDFEFCSYSHHSLLNGRPPVLALVHTKREHWNRVSLLLELTSSAYSKAVPRFELGTSDNRGELVTNTPPAHVAENSSTFHDRFRLSWGSSIEQHRRKLGDCAYLMSPNWKGETGRGLSKNFQQPYE
ncbi:hypothetical protein CSKR_109875 [Clonorchis sinensis]|uniref:Uncharacterized protein n=1 Tax=Clonorchis sinensis TaxID=79923 RepID=A0A419PNX3_CLOSI|nr:hypothetical protein CSKR_109875 [Clonorchis sinensis]